VAPAWGYSEGTHLALAARGIPAWLRPTASAFRTDSAVHETVDSAFRGLHGLDYLPFTELAGLGLPPTPVFHGGLFDLRLQQVRASRDVVGFARLAVRRDIVRLPSIRGIQWVGAGELVRLLDAHGSIEVRGREIDFGAATTARLLGDD
jgi:hypothetical protein